MNPYEAPSTSDRIERQRNASTRNTTGSRFRWRVIPASISWLIGGVCLLSLPPALYNNRQYLSIDFEWPWILRDIALLATYPLMLAAGFTYIFAGRWWMQCGAVSVRSRFSFYLRVEWLKVLHKKEITMLLSDEAKLIAEKAKQIYEKQLRERLESSDHGRFVCIEPESGDDFLGNTFDDAVNQAIDAHPDRLTHTLRVGHAAAFHIGVLIR